MKFPVKVTSRKAEVKIYGKSEAYPFYRIAYKAAGKRNVRSFANEGCLMRFSSLLAAGVSLRLDSRLDFAYSLASFRLDATGPLSPKVRDCLA
jgi:hypothetical protein